MAITDPIEIRFSYSGIYAEGHTTVSVVDRGSTSDRENGSWQYPWKTIQRGINALYGSPEDASPAPPSAAGQSRVLVIAAGTYHEDLVLPPAGSITLKGMGPVGVGTFSSQRTLIRTVDPAVNVDAPSVPTLVMDEVSLFGTATFADAGSGQIQNLVLQNKAAFFGGFDATGQTEVFNLSLDKAQFFGPWQAPTAHVTALGTSWSPGSTPFLEYFFSCDGCSFPSGFTISSDPQAAILRNTVVAGTVSSPTDLRVDFFTNQMMRSNAVAKTGGWSTTIPIGSSDPY